MVNRFPCSGGFRVLNFLVKKSLGLIGDILVMVSFTSIING